MQIEVKTATENCAEKCKYFKVETVDLYKDNEIYHRDHRCKHYHICRMLLEDIRREYGRIE